MSAFYINGRKSAHGLSMICLMFVLLLSAGIDARRGMACKFACAVRKRRDN